MISKSHFIESIESYNNISNVVFNVVKIFDIYVTRITHIDLDKSNIDDLKIIVDFDTGVDTIVLPYSILWCSVDEIQTYANNCADNRIRKYHVS